LDTEDLLVVTGLSNQGDTWLYGDLPELLKESSRNNRRVANKGVRIQQSATNDTAHNNADSSANRLTAKPDNCAASHSTQIRYNLSNSDFVLGEVELVLQHGRIQILTTVAHKVEARHEKNEINKQEPVVLEGDFSFFDEYFALSVCTGFGSQALTLLVGLSLGEHETPDDE